ncbi:GNAT family N-acetyltransferase [Oceanidesulfovibrio marinus]|uniref:GNAT family N-acetyltransferase n=1 Tax=Oceanidesulfovibrio marinus TaxID=370038 RepID=A0ABX6NDN0_9BACT|nr:GNAT family N-acetyltransferase [Oceanidesulfovibrio marinus]QJT08168.1 GNAT family N-acetyltransferase [Oceanidesulfovibrio marinus]
MDKREIHITQAESDADMDVVRGLFRTYAAGLGFDLCFQNFEDELASMPGKYAPPEGRLFLARDEETGEAIGCVGVRPCDLGCCEMKRLYIAPEARGCGLGRRLAECAIEAARDIGYRYMRLDTIPKVMGAATRLYMNLGFVEISSYYDNPIEGVAYLQLDLAAAKRGA